MTATPLLPALIDAAALDAHRGDPELRIFDTTVLLQRPPEGGPYEVVSGRAGYEQGHIPGAAFADLAADLADPDAPFAFTLPRAERFARAAGALGIGDGAHVVVYAQSATMWATRLWWLLRYFGFDAVSVLDGGLPAWRAAGLPLETAATPYPPATFTARPRPELLATRADVEAIARGETPACLVNALSPEVFRGEGPSSYSRPGRIPGSVSLPHATLVDPGTNRFRPLPQLRTALDAAGAQPGQQVVAYCGGGISATVDVFAWARTGRDDVKLYDGSLTEWTADPDLPVEVG
ncbi:sulfurtransferase [Conexibacter sp. JD483]|uniref:sulfurtransferase n=1 Tax=unclassified Conexibacter TaxID=2627773 RepID=UPI00271B25BB|nr:MULTISPECIES: sulfurtransferase [unclassified Conexibacter]MDO8184602.1 sulfurtransferase [Conexibacter sp. CPCC 205706]MDO8197908.1 sulfurtransferase [Conexibacter sp. CPCC 205762]MDR9370127.1 sulfurtransferase [Conexibacter sp. JD483]